MRILWIKAGGLLPLDTGGKIRSYHTLRELARRHQVTIFTFYEAHAGDAHHELEALPARVAALPLQLPRRRSLAEYLSYARLIFSRDPYTMARFYKPAVRRELRRFFSGGEFDVAVCDFLHPAGVVPWAAPCAKVIFTHNAEGEVWRRQAGLEPNVALRAAYAREARALERAERRYLPLADHVLAVSERNRATFSEFLDPARITVVPTGVDTEYFQPASLAEADPPQLVFTGSMDWAPNDDAVRYFVRDILPRVREQVPAASFWAVGRRPSAALSNLADGSAVRVTGAVDDIRPYLQRGAVYVVPMRSGSGTRLKIFEAMAAGKAVVSTATGAEGLPLTHGRDVVLADTPDEFADAIVTLLRDAPKRRELGNAARALVEERHSWKAAGAAFEAALERVVNRGSRAAATPHPG